MPGVVAFFGNAFLAAIGIGAASAGVIMGVGAAVITLTVASVRRAAKLKDPGEVNRVSGTTVMVRSTEVPRIVVLGESLVGGVITYLNTTGTEFRSLYYEIVHAAHEIDSYIGWYLDDKYIPIADVDGINGEGIASGSDDGRVGANSGGHGLDPYSSTPVLYLRGHLGTDSQAVDSMLDSAFADIGTNHRHRGCAKTVVRCELVQGGESKWNGRSPNQITPVVRGMMCYDPRLDSTFPGGAGSHRLATTSTWEWTDNPALQWGTYRILAAPIGPAWDSDRIDWQSVFDAANVCDALVAIPTSTTEKRFRCDLTFDASMEPREVISKILATMGGKERHFNGQWHVYAAGWPSTDFALTDDDVIGELQYRKQPQIEDRYNQVKPRYIDRARLWKPLPGIAVTNTTLRTNRDNGRTLPKELELDGVTREYQAQRLAMYALNQADDTGILIFQTGYNGLNIRVGDTGTVTISELGFSAKTFRCVGWKWIDFVGAQLTLKEDSSGNYTDPIEGEYSTRSAAGTITFGKVTPWYLLKQPALRWIADSAGKPAGIRGVSNVTDRSQVSLNSAGNMLITSSPDGTVIYGFPAVPISDAKRYALTLRHKSSATASSGFYVICYEKSSALATGKTHLTGGSGSEAICDTSTSLKSLVNNGPMPGTTMIEQAYEYVPTSGAKYMCLAFGNFTSGTADYELESVSLVEAGTTVNVLPGLAAQTDMPDLVPESTQILVASQPADATKTLPFISYSGGGTLVDYSVITSATWTNDRGESVDVVLRQSARVQLASSDSLIGRKLAIRWTLNGGSSYSYDGTNTDNINITAADWQPKSTQRTVTVAPGETITVESIIVLVIPDPTTGDPADVQYRGLSLSIEAILR